MPFYSRSHYSYYCFLGLFTLNLALQACDSSIFDEKTVTERVCEPGLQSGCPQGKHCSVDALGVPICLTIPNDPLQVHRLCTSSQECEPGSGCIQFLGEARCAKLCSLEIPQEEANQRCQTEVGVGSECILSLLNREEIGVCSVPCHLGSNTDTAPSANLDMSRENEINNQCSMDESCSINLGLPYATCRTVGAQTQDGLCGINMNCQRGLSCVADGGLARCKTVHLSSQQCDPSEIEKMIQYARDPISGHAYYTCWSDIALKAVNLLGVHYRLILNRNRGQEVKEICTQLTEIAADQLFYLSDLDFESPHHLDLFDELKLLLEQTNHQVSGIWLPVIDEHCLRLDLTSGTLEPTPCDLELPVLCAYQPQEL